MKIILFILGVIGMTHVIVDASIFEWMRNFIDKKLPESVSKLIHCYQCTGFWCGIFCGWAAFNTFNIPQLFLAGCAGSLLANFAAIYMNYLEARTIVNLDDKTGE
ncbi:MAG: hypothetical protein GTO02_00230 [Candidatus Dadabacteria bacterium]|nr:hypothetical protein [Candidatus Dadabacteria bacterium]